MPRPRPEPERRPDLDPEPRVPLTPEIPHEADDLSQDMPGGGMAELGGTVGIRTGAEDIMTILRRIEDRLAKIERHLDMKVGRASSQRSRKSERSTAGRPQPRRARARGARPSAYA